MQSAYGQLEQLPEGYRVNHARIDMIDEQNVERCLLFPTLGDCVEGLMHDNVPMAYKVFHAFNLWLEEDWGYAYKDRLYAPPYIPMLDPDLAADELEFLLEQGHQGGVDPSRTRQRPVARRPVLGPVLVAAEREQDARRVPRLRRASRSTARRSTRCGAQSLTDPGYNATLSAGDDVRPRHPRARPWRSCSATCSAGSRTCASPASSSGCAWTPYALHMVDHAGSLLERRIMAFGQTMQDLPSDVFKEHIYISPFPEEDVVGLTELIGVDRVLMGSDWPHPEGNIMPGDFADSIQKLPEADIKKIMRDNLLELLGRPS